MRKQQSFKCEIKCKCKHHQSPNVHNYYGSNQSLVLFTFLPRYGRVLRLAREICRCFQIDPIDLRCKTKTANTFAHV
jgi:hypothetical protein